MYEQVLSIQVFDVQMARSSRLFKNFLPRTAPFTLRPLALFFVTFSFVVSAATGPLVQSRNLDLMEAGSGTMCEMTLTRQKEPTKAKQRPKLSQYCVSTSAWPRPMRYLWPR